MVYVETKWNALDLGLTPFQAKSMEKSEDLQAKKKIWNSIALFQF